VVLIGIDVERALSRKSGFQTGHWRRLRCLPGRGNLRSTLMTTAQEAL
jgi:hypothetical protein